MLAMVLAVLTILAIQSDFGPALLLFSVMLAMLYAASGRLSYVVLGLALLLVAGAAAASTVQHVRVRVGNWIDPWSQATGSGYQLVQALYALASGGVLGAGLDAGSPRYIPAVHTDFVIAAIGEELGLIGSLAVINLFVVLTLLGLRVAVRARSGFNALLATGLTAVLALQALIILAGTLKLIPMTGITLPFVSYGGSSVLANFLLIGLLLRISHEENARA
jgi:cell division protein FtsW